MVSTIETHNRHIFEEWPADGLERVEHCPVCGCAQRHQLYSGLTDEVFRCAPGRWDLYQCKKCRSAYLDPRPTPESIALAYQNYYTHEGPSSTMTRTQSLHRRMVLALSNDYRNKRYGTGLKPTCTLGRWLLPLLPPLRTPIDRKHRFLPPATSKHSRLLDVGFGSGEFMLLAQQMGYQAIGVDQDRISVDNAKKAGLDVRQGGIDALEGAEAFFDIITINHVIEHLHDPIRSLETALRFLKPGGSCTWRPLISMLMDIWFFESIGAAWKRLVIWSCLAGNQWRLP